MKTHIGPSQILCGRIVRCLQASAAMAALALSISACGDDKKTSDNKSDTPTVNDPATTPVIDSNTSVPSNNTGGTITVPTSTSIKVTLDGGATAAPDGTYAVLSSDASTVTIYSYDFCAYVAAHDPASVPYAGNGAGIILKVGPTGANATANTTYTVATNTTTNGVTYDKNVIATYRDYPAGSPANECDITTRGALSGSASWTTVSSTSFAGTVDATVVSYQPGTTSTVKGSFVASKCASTALGATPYASDAAACHDAADQTVRETSGGLHYK